MSVQCEVCNRYFKTPDTLKNHQAFHERQAKKAEENQEPAKKKKVRSSDHPTMGNNQSVNSVQKVEAVDVAVGENSDKEYNNTSHVPLPFALTPNRLGNVCLSPMSLWLCSLCTMTSTRKEAWQFKDSGRMYVTISMCKQCVEANTEMQKTANKIWADYFQKKAEEKSKKEAFVPVASAPPVVPDPQASAASGTQPFSDIPGTQPFDITITPYGFEEMANFL